MVKSKLAAGTLVAIVLGVGTACAGTSTKSGSSGSGSSGGKHYNIAFVPKLVGIPYFTAMQTGGQEASKALGVNFIYQGGTTSDIGPQVENINSLVQRHVDAIAVSADDPAADGAALGKAKAASILTLSSDADVAQPDRKVWVNQAGVTALGQAISNALASQMGGKGEYAIVSCGPTATNLNQWIAVEKSYIGSKYPGMKLDTVVFAGEDQAGAVTSAKQVMAAHPTLRGLIGECSTSAPGVAQAITEEGKIGKVVATGIGTPTVMAPFIKSGAEAKVVLWDPVKLGYLTVWAAKYLLDGHSFHPGSYNVGGPIGAVTYYSQMQELRLGPPLTFTKANIGQFAGKF